MTRRRYAKPPIIEALLDIQVRFDRELDLTELQAVGATEEAIYPTREPLHNFSMVFDTQKGTSISSSQEFIGYRYWSSTRDRVFQVRSNGLLYSKLPPYTAWEEWRDEARRLWHVYRSQLNPSAITKLAVRYINRIDLPGGQKDMAQFLRARPEVPEDMRLAARQFGLHLESALEGIDGGSVSLRQGTAPHASADVHSVLLDLDLSRSSDIAVQDDKIWDYLQELHDRESELFESCITDATRSLFV